MKKGFYLLLFVLFLFPIATFAKDEEWRRWETLNEEIYCADNSATNLYGTEVTYENGKYTVGGTTGTDLVFRWSYAAQDYDHVYTCKNGDETVCENVYLVFQGVRCHGFNNRVGIKLTGGNTYEKDQSFYIGDGYTLENGTYTLTNPEAHPYSEMTNESYISDTYVHQYLCEGYGKTCKKAWILFSVINPATGNNYLAGVNVEDYYLMSEQYRIENDQFVLINPKVVYPVLETGTGYSCHDHSTTCTTLYRLTIDDYYDNHDGRRAVYDLLTITNTEQNKLVQLRERIEATELFSSVELRKTVSTNSEVAEIVNNELKLYKIGKTDLVYADDSKYKVVHLTVTNEPKTNPYTSSSALILVIMGFVFVFFLSLFQSMRKA